MRGLIETILTGISRAAEDRQEFKRSEAHLRSVHSA